MARKASMWAKEAGEYYRKNVGKNGIESFTDVLKSSDFKKEYYAKNGKAGAKTNGNVKGSRKRGGDGDAVNATTAPVLNASAATNAVATSSAPTNTTGGEIQVPMENIMGVMKTGGMKMGEMRMKKGKSMKKKGKMTKKRSLKNKKNRRMTKKYMGGSIDDIKTLLEKDSVTVDELINKKGELINELSKKNINNQNIISFDNTTNLDEIKKEYKKSIQSLESVSNVTVNNIDDANKNNSINSTESSTPDKKERCFVEIIK
jgi:hypothetical protein